MKHNIAIVNAAIALGDKVTLPIGTRILHKENLQGSTIGTIANLAYTQDGPLYYVAGKGRSFRLVPPDSIIRVISIPETDTPFHQWHRWGGKDG